MAGVAGKISWFGGPGDPSSGPRTASGAPVSQPGIAVYNRATLGGYWLVALPNGRRAVLQQTDIGPAPSTGRKTDFTYSALPALGYSTSTFPTDETATTEYLGKSVPPSLRSLLIGPDSSPGAATGSSDPTSQALMGGSSASGAGGSGLFGSHHSELLYATVWAGAIALALLLFYHGLDSSTGGEVSRTRKHATTAVKTAAAATPK